MEIPDSADVEPDFEGFPAIPVQPGIFITPSARVSPTIPFGKRIQNTDTSFILKDEVLLALRCAQKGISQNSQKSKKEKNARRGDFYLKMPLFP